MSNIFVIYSGLTNIRAGSGSLDCAWGQCGVDSGGQGGGLSWFGGESWGGGGGTERNFTARWVLGVGYHRTAIRYIDVLWTSNKTDLKVHLSLKEF